MEIRCFLVPLGSNSKLVESTNTSFIDIPLVYSDGRRAAPTIIGRHSPELYWCLGNDLRCSLRMMSFTNEELETNAGEEEKEDISHNNTTCLHPRLSHRVILKALGKNPLRVRARRIQRNNTSEQHERECNFTLRCNESLSLRAGDIIGIANRIWMQVVVAQISIRQQSVIATKTTEAAAMPNVQVSPVRRSLFSHALPPWELIPLPVIRVSRYWNKLTLSLRARLVQTVWRLQFPTDSHTSTTTATVKTIISSVGVPLSMGNGSPIFASYEVGEVIQEEKREEKAGTELEIAGVTTTTTTAVFTPLPISNIINTNTMESAHVSSQVDGEYRTLTSSSQNTRNKRKKCMEEEESQLLDAASVSKKRRNSNARLSAIEAATPARMPETNTYFDTYDEGLDESVCALEARVAVRDQIITEVQPPPVLLGDSPPPDGRSEEPKTGISLRGNKSITVSRTQLLIRNKENQHQVCDGENPVLPPGDESQVVYYRH